MNLLDDFKMVGTDLQEFKDAIEQFTKESKTIPVKGWEIGLYSFFEKDRAGNYKFFRIDEDTLVEQSRNINARRTIAIRPGDIEKDMIEEIMQADNPGLLLYLGDKVHYFSAGAIGTLAQRAGFQTSWLSKKSVFKAEAIMEGLCMNERVCNLVIHSNEVMRRNGTPARSEKVFAVMGSHYQPVPMTIVSEAADKILSNTTKGKIVIKGWEISHRYTRIAFEFPDEAIAAQKAYGLPDLLIPGVIIQNSDTGDCSITAYGTFRKSNSKYPIIFDEAMSRTHVIPKRKIDGTENLSMTSAELVKTIDETLLKNLRVLPKALAEKMATPVYDFDPESVVVKPDSQRLPKEYRENLEAVSNLITKWGKDLQLVGVIGKKRTKELLDEMIDEIDPSQVYTEYDIAMDFLTISDRIAGGISQQLREALAKKCKDAPFLKGMKKKASDSEKVYLTPEL